MRRAHAVSIAMILLGLTGCHKVDGTFGSDGSHHGRYAGIGLFEPSKLWTKLQGEDPKDPAAAKLDDDEMIIVVVDSDTGEIRECGNYSGRCVSMNPWTKAIAPQQHAPVAVNAHAAELARADSVENATTTDLEPAKPASARKH